MGSSYKEATHKNSDFIGYFVKQPFPLHLGKLFNEFGKKYQKYTKMGK